MKLKSLLGVVTGICLFAPSINAQMVSRGSGPRGSSSSYGHSSAGNMGTASTASEVSCKDSKELVPQSFFHAISFKDEGLQLKSEVIGDKIKITIPEHITACTNFSVDYYQDNGGDIFVKIKNNFQFTTDNMALTDEEASRISTMSGLTKHNKCLKKKGIVDENNVVQWDKVNGDQRGQKTLEFPIKKDANKSANIYFGSPDTSLAGNLMYPVKQSSFEPISDQGITREWSCLSYENFQQKNPKRIYTSPRDQITQSVAEACESQDLETIFDHIASLQENGNAPDLLKVLTAVADELKEEKIDELEDELRDLKKEARDKPDQEDAEEIAERYIEVLNEIQKLVVMPNAREVQYLQNNLTPQNKKASMKRINILLKEIRDHGTPGFKLEGSMESMMRRHGLVNELKDFYDIHLTARAYSNVGPKSKSIKYSKKDGVKRFSSLKKANEWVREESDKFEEDHLEIIEAAYDVSEGDFSAGDHIIDSYEELQRRREMLQNKSKYNMMYNKPTECTEMIQTTYRAQQCQSQMQSMQQRAMYADQSIIKQMGSQQQGVDAIYAARRMFLANNPSYWDDSYGIDGNYDLTGYDTSMMGSMYNGMMNGFGQQQYGYGQQQQQQFGVNPAYQQGAYPMTSPMRSGFL